MVALAPGTKAPSFTLRSSNGESYSLSDALAAHPVVVLAFFKVSCPVCQFAFPYLERLHRSYPSIPIWGVSQDDADATDAFAKSYGISFPMPLDESLETTVEYDLTNVPTVFLVQRDGSIAMTSVGFVKDELDELNTRLAAEAKTDRKPLFTAADEVPALRPG